MLVRENCPLHILYAAVLFVLIAVLFELLEGD